MYLEHIIDLYLNGGLAHKGLVEMGPQNSVSIALFCLDHRQSLDL